MKNKIIGDDQQIIDTTLVVMATALYDKSQPNNQSQNLIPQFKSQRSF
tara:strand:+ start:474 stop:617 length:144 start_codon:yes stop_codon:yes gene_type:complete